jgi:hypothetical protein
LGGGGETDPWDFDQIGTAIDVRCFGIPNCTVSEPSELMVSFGMTIEGLAALDAQYMPGSPDGMINGQLIGEFGRGFFGISGPFSELDFTGCLLCDFSSDHLYLNDIFIVLADEPPPLACIGAGLITTIVFSLLIRRDHLSAYQLSESDI